MIGRAAAGRTVLVTGAASGIGRAVVGRLAGTGSRVVATDLDADRLAKTAAEDGWDAVVLRPLDVADRAAWTALPELAGLAGATRLVIVNAAGVSHAGPVEDTSPELAAAVLGANVLGTIGAVTAAAAAVRSGRAATAHAVTVASFAALTAVPGLALYSASKHAARAFCLAARQELRGTGVDVTVVCVDAVATPMLARQVGAPEAAVVFGAPRDLVCGRVLSRRPAEVTLPRRRGLVMKIGGAAPGLGAGGARRFARAGRARQAALAALPPDDPGLWSAW